MNKLLYISFIALLSGNAMCMSQNDDSFVILDSIPQELSASGKSSSEVQSMIDKGGLNDVKFLEEISKKPAAVLNADVLNDICLAKYDEYSGSYASNFEF